MNRRPSIKVLDYEWRLKYSPDQPRVPAGSPEGGRWTSHGGSPAVLEMDDFDVYVVEPGQQLDAEQVYGVNQAMLSPDGVLLLSVSDEDDFMGFIAANHAEIIQAYEGTQERFDKYVRGYVEEDADGLLFRSRDLFMGIGGADDWESMTTEEIERRSWRNYGRVARALRNAGFPVHMRVVMQTHTGSVLEMPISEAVDWKWKEE